MDDRRVGESDFQIGLRNFSLLLMQVAAVLTTLILITNIMLHRRLIDAVLFSKTASPSRGINRVILR